MGPKGDLFPILDLVGAGRLKPIVDRTMPLVEAQAAHRLLQERAIFGKIVLTP
jgi:NADPH:quinone reductase-like Zn-dependent oxidoreductase